MGKQFVEQYVSLCMNSVDAADDQTVAFKLHSYILRTPNKEFSVSNLLLIGNSEFYSSSHLNR